MRKQDKGGWKKEGRNGFGLVERSLALVKGGGG